MRQLFFIPTFFIGLCVAGTISAQVSTFTLDNGMEAVVIEDHRAPVVTQMVWYRVGAADEPPGKSGIAHFLEHLMFKGTDEIPEGAFSKIIAANGGVDNAFTSFDYTGYFQRIAADRLELVMRMEADRMRDLVLSEEVVIPERDVIIEERNSRVDNDPGALFSEQRSAALYLNHPYGIPVIGWKHEMEQLTRQDALDFYAKYYAPNNAILIVAGDVTPERVEELAKTYYGPLAPTADLPPRHRPQEPPQLAARRLEYHDARVRQPYVIRSYLSPNRVTGAQEKAASLTLLAEILGGGGVTSVLGEALQLDRQLAVSTGAFYSGTGLDPQSFGVFVVPASGVELVDAEAAMDEVLRKFAEEGPDEAHLERVKKQLHAAEIYALDDQQGRARMYGSALTSGLTIEDIEGWPEVVYAVTAEDVRLAAVDVLKLRNSVTGWLMGAEDAQ